MRKNLIMSWPQIIVLLLIAGSILITPAPGPWPFVAGGLLAVLVLLGIFYKVRAQQSPPVQGKDDVSPAQQAQEKPHHE